MQLAIRSLASAALVAAFFVLPSTAGATDSPSVPGPAAPSDGNNLGCLTTSFTGTGDQSQWQPENIIAVPTWATGVGFDSLARSGNSNVHLVVRDLTTASNVYQNNVDNSWNGAEHWSGYVALTPGHNYETFDQWEAWNGQPASMTYCIVAGGTAPAANYAVTGNVCIADPSFVGPVTGCSIWYGPKNPNSGNVQQDLPVDRLYVDVWESPTGNGASDATLLASTQTDSNGQYSLSFAPLHTGDYLWYEPRMVENANQSKVVGVNYQGSDYDLRSATWQTQSYAMRASSSLNPVAVEGDFRAFLPNAEHWDWWGSSASLGTAPKHTDWLRPNAPNGFGGIPGGSLGIGGMTVVGVVIPLNGEPEGQTIDVPVYGDGTVCWSSNTEAPTQCIDVTLQPTGSGQQTGDASLIEQTPTVIRGVGPGGIEVQEGSVMIGSQVKCTVGGNPALGFDSAGCAIFGPPATFQTPANGTVPAPTPNNGQTGPQPVNTSSCQLLALPSHFDLMQCLVIIFVPQKSIDVRFVEVQTAFAQAVPFAAIGYVDVSYMQHYDDSSCIDLHFPAMALGDLVVTACPNQQPYVTVRTLTAIALTYALVWTLLNLRSVIWGTPTTTEPNDANDDGGQSRVEKFVSAGKADASKWDDVAEWM